jgi:hypothetical protein
VIVYTAASAAYGAAWSWGQYGKYDDPDDPDFYERQQKYDDAELEMLVLMRRSLSIPETDLTLPPPGYSYEVPQVERPAEPEQQGEQQREQMMPDRDTPMPMEQPGDTE